MVTGSVFLARGADLLDNWQSAYTACGAEFSNMASPELWLLATCDYYVTIN